MKAFFVGRSKSIVFALRGVFKLISTEHSIMVQVFIAILLTFIGFYFSITKVEWMFQTMIIGLVLGIEGLNTAVEKISDFVHPEHHKKIGFIKDIAAGSVFFAAIASLIVLSIIYLPYIVQ